MLVLCDPRLIGKSYGRLFLDSLPPLPRTRVLGDVQRFFGAEADVGSRARSTIAETRTSTLARELEVAQR